MGCLGRFGRDWNKFGKRNPYGAILTGTAGDLPEWNEHEFFETGRLDATRFMADLARIAPSVGRRTALDFGCGVGRVTRALAAHFESVVGVDVASAMIARARYLNRSCSNCTFVVARPARLRAFKNGAWDVIYGRLVLQHIPQALVRRYIPEFLRVLAPGGALMFQLPSEISQEPEELFLQAPVVGGSLKSKLPRPVVRAYRRLKYRFIMDESEPAMAMFGMARREVEELLAEAGGGSSLCNQIRAMVQRFPGLSTGLQNDATTDKRNPRMTLRLLPAAVLVIALVGCAADAPSGPELPPVDEAAYKAEHEEWRKARQAAIVSAVQIIGLWPLAEGETAFGGDSALPIVLPAPPASPKVGIFKREGDKITVVPTPSSPLRMADGGPVTGPVELKTVMAADTTVLALGSIRLQIEEVFEKQGGLVAPRRWVSAWDEEHPATKNLPPAEVFPLDQRWRVAARFEPFAAPKPTRIPDVRGGFMDLVATGQLVFKLNDREQRLTAIGFEGRDDLFVMFKDKTNASTTYSGYRILFPTTAGDEEWTVLDFNLAENPPCAYSRFTTCPLPPPENKIDVAVEAGEKRYPAAKGYVPAVGGC